jgi:hypothetical protein
MAATFCFTNFIAALDAARKQAKKGLMTRVDLEDALIKQGLNEKEVTDAIHVLYDAYHGELEKIGKKKMTQKQKEAYKVFVNQPSKIVPASQQEILNKIGKKFGVDLYNKEDYQNLETIAKKADKLDGAIKAQELEKFYNYIEQKDPEYYRSLQGSVIAFKTLLSVGFTVKSMMSNWTKRLTRAFAEMTRTSDGVRLRKISLDTREMNAYASAIFKDVLKGGVSVSQMIQSEYENSLIESRATEFSNPREKQGFFGKTGFRWANRQLGKYSERLMSAIDSQTRTKLAEYHYRRLLVQKLKTLDPTMSEKDVQREVYKSLYAMNTEQAKTQAEQDFRDWGMVDKTGDVDRSSAKYKRRVGELIRSGRDPDLMEKASALSAADVWQKKMTIKGSPLQKYDTMVGGALADGMSMLRDLNTKMFDSVAEMFYPANKQKAALFKAKSDVAIFQIYGFINGRMAYFEDYLEHFLPYGLMKQLGLSRVMNNPDLSPEQVKYVKDRIHDITIKYIVSTVQMGVLFGLAALAKSICGEGGVAGGKNPNYKEQAVQAQQPQNSLDLCGLIIPLEYMGGQTASMTKFISAIASSVQDDDSGMAVVLAGLGNMSPDSPIGSSQISTIQSIGGAFTKAVSDNREDKWRIFGDKVKEDLFRITSDASNKFLPIPDRLIKETSQVISPYREYAPLPNDKPTASAVDYIKQSAIQGAYQMGQAAGVVQLMNSVESAQGFSKPVFDYRHRQ